MSSMERQSDERDELIACPECGWEIAEKNIAEHYRIIHTTQFEKESGSWVVVVMVYYAQ